MDKITVTKAFLPPIEEYTAQLQRAWDNQWLTNRGELVIELEEKLKTFLGVPEILVMNNGTIPLQIALKMLANKGEVITTPFSYVATTSSIVWEGCTPVFVDIDPTYLTIDETKIESAITERTTAILATHVFGNPCNVEVIDDIAKRYGLHVIYDAAHCFNVRYKGRSIFEYGDMSTCSFHATKLFHTGEGGALFCNNPEYTNEVFYSHNFGHDGPTRFQGLGINGKISEIQAALGLSVLPYLSEILTYRKSIIALYNSLLAGKVRKMKLRENCEWNYSYYPIILESESLLIKVVEDLNNVDIFPRRYFYPSLNTISYTSGPEMPISEDISPRILCIPVFYGMSESDVYRICTILENNL